MIKQIPKALIYSRLFPGIGILVSSIFQISNSLSIVLFITGMLTDVFDGIVARQLNMSTRYLRRLDSTIDQFFFLFVSLAIFIQSPQFFYQNEMKIIILISTEFIAYVICFVKFKKEIATHSILSKGWALILFATLLQVMITKNSTILFEFCFYIGIVTRVEIIVIVLLLRTWLNDVPGIYQAVLLRQGKPIRRNKLLNG
jgi:CDP-diacylglycerol--glycerol-3-phosphate 3-phosphatidyltransferase